MSLFCYSELDYSKIATQLLQEYSDHLNELVTGVHNPTDATNHLITLYQLKLKKLPVHKYDPQMCLEYFLLHPLIKQYLEWAVEKAKNQEFEALNDWLKKLVSPVDLFILDAKDKEFTSKLKCIYSADIAYSIPEVIKLEWEHLLDFFTVIRTLCIRLLVDLSEGVRISIPWIENYFTKYQGYMEKAKQKYEKLLVETHLLLLRYDAQSNRFKKVSMQDLEKFTTLPESAVKEHFEIIKLQNVFKVQAYLFELTTEIGLNYIVDDESLITGHIGYIVRELSFELSPLLKAVLNVCKNDYKQIKRYLVVINKGQNWSSELDILFSNSSIRNVKEGLISSSDILFDRKFISTLHSVLNTLQLTNMYPQRLGLRDALTIKPEISESNISLSNLPYVVLHKIIACDHRSRSFLLSSQDDDDSDSEGSSTTKHQSAVHPVDTILALIHCSDNFLRQVLLAKLSICQMAIPLLLPDASMKTITLLLWALRSVKKTWSTIDSDGKITISKSSIVDHEGPIVSFLKCGKLQTSKSELLNNIIGEENIFFHWNLEYQNCGKSICQGVVELSCYYPSGDNSSFNDAIIFTNLRGDAVKYTKQVLFIKSISFLSFVLISKNSIESNNKEVVKLLQMLSCSPGGLVLLLTNTETYKKEDIQELLKCDNFSVICIDSKSSAVLQRKIRNLIIRKLQNVHSLKFESIASYIDTARKLDIAVDEDDAECIKGKERALQVMKHVTKPKQHILPLQGPDLWGTWGMLNKERYRYKQKQPNQELSVAEYMQSKDEEKTAVRLLQFYCNFSEFTRDVLVNLVQSRAERNYFLHWLKECLNNYSKDILPTLEKKYEETYMEYRSASELEVNKRIKNLLNQHNKKLVDASFGLEHCFREVGQIYEAVKGASKEAVTKNVTEFINVLPQIAAEALIDGFELEIMDGEASHVPVTWIQAIFDYLETVFVNKNLFVLSILGIQSSGKSTLLNTMFGLQFNVSAGRCTRGAFIRLLQVDKTLNNKLHYDFILVVDTEGIRAPELMSEEFEQHDNELATFVIGLADFTIINIYGETPTELNDILQTVLHAFIRMKEVEKNPGCLFVHQNVTEKFASNQLKTSKQVLFNRLDKLTVAVSKEENCQYSKFHDVISFDEDHIVYYFTGLWKGDPPMAPINFGYSQSAQQLKRALLKLIARQKHYCTFTAFKLRILNLWEAILKEGFVFNFRNSVEMSAYSELEVQFNKWSWQLHETLESELIKCDHKINSSKCDTENVKNVCVEQACKELNTKCLMLVQDLDNFFEKHDHASILSKYLFSTRQKLEDLKKECQEKIKHYCKILMLQVENNRGREEMLCEYRDKIRTEIMELVNTSSANLSDNDLQSLFEASWKKWLENFKKKMSFIQFPDDKQICNNIENSLINIFVNQKGLLMSQLKGSSIENRCLKQKPSDIMNPFEVIKVHIYPYGNDFAVLQGLANSQSTKLSKEVSASIKQKLCSLNVYSSGLIEAELNTLFFSINNFNTTSTEFKFTSQYIADIALHVCVDAALQIKTWVKQLKQRSDSMLSLLQQKDKFFKIFENKYRKISAEKAAANQLCNSLVDPIFKAVRKKMHLNIVNHWKKANPNMNSKTGFKLQVLTDMANSKNFTDYKAYFVDSRTSFKRWVYLYVEKHCTSKSSNCKGIIFTELANEEVKEVISVIQNAISATEIHGSSKWLTQFCTKLNGTIAVDLKEWKKDLKDIKEVPERMKSFTMHLSDELSALQMSNTITQQIYEKLNELVDIAGETLFNSIMGLSCNARCPFCKEECDNPVFNHTVHSVQLHRPQCIGGTTWHEEKTLVIDVCNSLVASGNDIVIVRNKATKRIAYKNYKKEFVHWDIPGQSEIAPPTYWMWVVAHFYNEILAWTNGKETKIPDIWKNITKKDAIDSLAHLHNT